MIKPCTYLLLCLASTPLLAHKFHVSFTQMEWNETNQTMEVVFQLFADDLEQAVSLFKGQKVALSRANEGDIFDYVRARFELSDASKTPLEPVWVGMELDVRQAWVYVEVPLPDGPGGLAVQQNMFFELFNDQINTVDVKIGTRKETHVFQKDSPKKALLKEH